VQSIYPLRVISGRFKGRNLASFEGRRIRPTTDRVREAIFNILTVEWEGKEVLDLFAGTGALGIEALSRGAHRVVFVEHHPHALGVLDRNIKTLNLSGNFEVVRLRVDKGIKFIKRRGWKFDISFLDPPYRKDLAESSLRLIDSSDVLKEHGMVVVEHHSNEILPEHYQRLRLIDHRKYGNTGVSFFVYTYAGGGRDSALTRFQE
jgi:16S rRNA (guanine966-N2)-methyltransferase